MKRSHARRQAQRTTPARRSSSVHRQESTQGGVTFHRTRAKDIMDNPHVCPFARQIPPRLHRTIHKPGRSANTTRHDGEHTTKDRTEATTDGMTHEDDTEHERRNQTRRENTRSKNQTSDDRVATPSGTKSDDRLHERSTTTTDMWSANRGPQRT